MLPVGSITVESAHNVSWPIFIGGDKTALWVLGIYKGVSTCVSSRAINFCQHWLIGCQGRLRNNRNYVGWGIVKVYLLKYL